MIKLHVPLLLSMFVGISPTMHRHHNPSNTVVQQVISSRNQLTMALAPRKSVIVIGDGYVAKNTLSSLATRHGNTVDVVAGVSDPFSFQEMEGVRATHADLWDKEGLTQALSEGRYCRVFLVLPGHADRVQMGWNGLEACRKAGILQVVLVSVLTAETQSESESTSSFKPLGDNVQKLGKVELSTSRSSAASPDNSPLSESNPKPTMVPTLEGDPATCVRIQRRNVLLGWFPMKVKLVQISLPNLDPASRCGKPSKMNLKAQDNGIAELQRAFLGPYTQSKTTAPKNTLGASFISQVQQELLSRKEQLMGSTRATAALSNFPQLQSLAAAAPVPIAACLPPLLPPTIGTAGHAATNLLLYSDVLQVLQERQHALKQRPHWL